MSVDILIYSHSEYSFFWPVMVGQFEKYNPHLTIHFLTDSTTPITLLKKHIPPSWIVHMYDPSMIWTDRIKKGLLELDSQYVLFLHEDWIPVASVSMERLKEIALFMSTKNAGCMLSFHNFGCDLNCRHTLQPTKQKEICNTSDPAYKYQNEPHHFFQPALWNRSIFLEYTNLLVKSKHQNEDLQSLQFWSLQNCWSVQNMETQYTIRTMNSYLFPHIHALSEGKWNLTKYPTLKPLLESYGLETESRGDHPWWELDTQ
jgi:hypothetical protein